MLSQSAMILCNIVIVGMCLKCSHSPHPFRFVQARCASTQSAISICNDIVLYHHTMYYPRYALKMITFPKHVFFYFYRKSVRASESNKMGWSVLQCNFCRAVWIRCINKVTAYWRVSKRDKRKTKHNKRMFSLVTGWIYIQITATIMFCRRVSMAPMDYGIVDSKLSDNIPNI